VTTLARQAALAALGEETSKLAREISARLGYVAVGGALAETVRPN
jgi:hypothetical protein